MPLRPAPTGAPPPASGASKKIGPERGAEAHGLGRSRGGLTTKVVLAATDEDTAVAVDVLPGHRHEALCLGPVLGRACERLERVDQAVCDRGCDGTPQRAACAALGAEPMISPANRVEPEEYDRAAYGERNRSSGCSPSSRSSAGWAPGTISTSGCTSSGSTWPACSSDCEA